MKDRDTNLGCWGWISLMVFAGMLGQGVEALFGSKKAGEVVSVTFFLCFVLLVKIAQHVNAKAPEDESQSNTDISDDQTTSPTFFEDLDLDQLTGFIYILEPVNPEYFGLVKIGFTTKKVSERIRNSSSSSTYLYDDVELFREIPIYGIEARSIESIIHDKLKESKKVVMLSNCKVAHEWFSITPLEAEAIINGVIAETTIKFKREISLLQPDNNMATGKSFDQKRIKINYKDHMSTQVKTSDQNVRPLELFVAFIVVIGLLTIAWNYEMNKYSEKDTTVPVTPQSHQNITSPDVFSANIPEGWTNEPVVGEIESIGNQKAVCITVDNIKNRVLDPGYAVVFYGKPGMANISINVKNIFYFNSMPELKIGQKAVIIGTPTSVNENFTGEYFVTFDHCKVHWIK